MKAYRTARIVARNCDVEGCTAEHFEHGGFGLTYYAPPPQPRERKTKRRDNPMGARSFSYGGSLHGVAVAIGYKLAAGRLT